MPTPRQVGRKGRYPRRLQCRHSFPIHLDFSLVTGTPVVVQGLEDTDHRCAYAAWWIERAQGGCPAYCSPAGDGKSWEGVLRGHLAPSIVDQLLPHLASLISCVHCELWDSVFSHATHQYPSGCTQVAQAGRLYPGTRGVLHWQTCGWIKTPLIEGMQYELRHTLTYQVRPKSTTEEGKEVRDNMRWMGADGGCSVTVLCRRTSDQAAGTEPAAASTRLFSSSSSGNSSLSEAQQCEVAPLGYRIPPGHAPHSRADILQQQRRRQLGSTLPFAQGSGRRAKRQWLEH